MLFRTSLTVWMFAIAATVAGVVWTGRSNFDLAEPKSQHNTGHQTQTGPAIFKTKDTQKSLATSCLQRAERLSWQLGESTEVASHPPFVLAGDLPASALDRRYANVIQPVCRVLKRRFFNVPPDESIAILLFSDEAIYRQSAERLFFDRDVSQFGYYKPGRRTVLVNLSEGDAALRHELVHALMGFDFPDAPPWLQEGVAAMYEAVETVEAGGELALEPIPHWRLTVLQRHFGAGNDADLRRLIASSNLRGPREAVNFALARYFCMFLHQRGHLESVYHATRDGIGSDPTGVQAVASVLGCNDWQRIDIEYRDWALQL